MKKKLQLLLKMTDEQYAQINELMDKDGCCCLCTGSIMKSEARSLVVEPGSERSDIPRQIQVSGICSDCMVAINNAIEDRRVA
jgi:hypothetical protein